jgi:hypothetical protein
VDILWKKPFHSSARGASFHTKHTSNANVVQVVSLDTNSYLALRERPPLRLPRRGLHYSVLSMSTKRSGGVTICAERLEGAGSE